MIYPSHKFGLTGFFMLWCIVRFTTAFSVNDIPQTDNSSIRVLVNEIAENEKYCTRWQQCWPYQIPRDSIVEHLKSIIYRTHKLKSKSVYQYELAMLEAVSWHHLYQLEVDSAFMQGSCCIQEAARYNPAAVEPVWLKGVHLIKASFISDGFKILDSLRLQTSFDCSSFLVDYAKLSALCFLPKNHRHLDTTFTIGIVQPRRFLVYMSQQEQLPVSEQWSVVTETGNVHRSPVYSFTAEFSLGKDFSLSFPGLKIKQDVGFSMVIPPDIASSISEPLVQDPFERKHDARISVQLNPLTGAPPLWKYMKQLATDGYDVVEQRNELEQLGAISLRCKMTSPFRNVTDRTYAFIVFDRQLPQSVNCFYKSPTIKLPPKTIAYRYRIAMECRGIVRSKAEELLQEVLREFADL